MVSTVYHCGVDDSHHVPDPGYREVRSHDDRPHDEGKEVGKDVLNGMAVDGSDADGCGPFMVRLVDILVHPPMVQQSAVKEGRERGRGGMTASRHHMNN